MNHGSVVTVTGQRLCVRSGLIPDRRLALFVAMGLLALAPALGGQTTVGPTIVTGALRD